MNPTATICLLFIGIGVVSFIAVAGVALIALGSSGAFDSKSSKTTSISPITSSSTTASSSSTSTIASSSSTSTNSPSSSTSTNSPSSSTSTNSPSSSTSTNAPVSTANAVLTALRDASIYPNGSSSQPISSFTQASDTFTPQAANQSTLTQAGYSTDNTSSIFEAGRTQVLFFQIPTVQSRRAPSVPIVDKNTETVNLRMLRATPDNVTDIGIHFGSVGQNDSIIVIPLPGVNGHNAQIPGVVVLSTNINGFTLIRIEIDLPASMCPLSNGITINECLNIVYQVYSIVNGNQITSYSSVDINVACGDVCALPSSSCAVSCTTCDGQQVSGADTPVSRRYDMGADAATFLFTYETYVIKDRITVWNSGNLVFDTGCVGASGTTNVTYSSDSSSIRVDVEPNCACTSIYGCTGTAWYFQVYCLNSTYTSQVPISSRANIPVKDIENTNRNIRQVSLNKDVPLLTDKDYIERYSPEELKQIQFNKQ